MRFTRVDGESQITTRNAERLDASPRNRRADSSSDSVPLDLALLSATHRPSISEFKNATVTQATLQVSKGRRFVIDRLCALQRSLPPRPIGVALDLVKAVWAEYDYSNNAEPVHWIDVMVEKGFQTLFG